MHNSGEGSKIQDKNYLEKLKSFPSKIHNQNYPNSLAIDYKQSEKREARISQMRLVSKFKMRASILDAVR